MKCNLLRKALILLLCACVVAVGTACVLGIALLRDYNLYEATPEQYKQDIYQKAAEGIAQYHAWEYADEVYGDYPQDLQVFLAENKEQVFARYELSRVYGAYDVSLSENGRNVFSLEQLDQGKGASVTVEVTPVYAVAVDMRWVDHYISEDLLIQEPENPAVIKREVIPVPILDAKGNEIWKLYTVDTYKAPAYQATVLFGEQSNLHQQIKLVELLYGMRHGLFWVAIVCLLLFLAGLVYLCFAAGRTTGVTEIKPGGWNRLPLDLFAAALWLLYTTVPFRINSFLPQGTDAVVLAIAMIGVAAGVLSIPIIGWLTALSAQVKCGKWHWWRNCVVCRVLLLLGRGLRWLVRGVGAVLRILPEMWKWPTAMLALVLIALYAGVWYERSPGNFLLLLVCVLAVLTCVAALYYCGYAFYQLRKRAKTIACGDLQQKVQTKYLRGSFLDVANSLNDMAGVIRRAVQEQTKADRMKTELITNVSHDLKTPLTSIINYTDLLQKPHTEEEQDAYLQVLERQAQRLKKLVGDLVDMSKASTGNMTAQISQVDGSETVRQALGEFADKLEKAELHVVLNCPQKPVMLLADGQLLWRVLSNLLGNVVKYAMPGTRVYLDLTEAGCIILKNISNEPLNIPAEELMERFVRGDAARNTEGSGLGLNIAQSLMQLQKGTMEVQVEGDLFMVRLTLPRA